MIDRKKVSRVLVISLTNIGDVILTIPVLEVLKAEFPGARMDLICGKAPVALFRGSPDLGKVFAYDKKWGLLQKWMWVREIAKERYDLVVDLRHTVIPVLVGAKYRTKLIRLRKPAAVSVREKHLSLLSDLGLNVNHRTPISLFGEDELASVKQKLVQLGLGEGARYAVIAPGGNSSTKLWPLAGFENVTRYLTGECDLNAVVVGGPGENWTALRGERVFDLTGKTSLRELAALVSGAELLVANDSSTMQLAQELAIRVVALFGPTNHRKYAKENPKVKVVRLDLECSPCEAAQCQIERRKCLDDLSPELVKQAIGDSLSFPRKRESSVFKEPGSRVKPGMTK